MKQELSCIVGCGDIGIRVGRLRQARGESVEGIVRSAPSGRAVAEEGIAARCLDLDQQTPDVAAAKVFWFAPPPVEGHTDPRIRRWLQALDDRPRRIVYISTTGVYGNTGQDWINEHAPINPATDRAKRRADAEKALRELSPTQTQFVILRVPGIYGPGRLPVTRLKQGLPVVDDADHSVPPRWTNRIHSEDLARIAVAAMDHGQHGAAYNASDGHPSTMCDYFSRCAALLGLPAPPRVSLTQARKVLSPQMLSFIEESRRISNRRMLDELNIQLLYPDLSAGLSACVI